jgi:hypothetical protein
MQKKVTKNCCILCVVDLGLWGENIQTKHMRHCPQCGGDVYVLGLGILTPQAKPFNAMVVAPNQNSFFARGVFKPGMIVRRIM